MDRPRVSPERHEQLAAAGRTAGSRPKHRWTDDERELVRQGYRGTNASAAAVGRRIGVSVWAVKGVVQQLGITRTKPHNWTEDEDERLIELMGRYSARWVAARMHRSINAVIVRAQRLGFSRRTRDGWYTMMDVSRMLGIDHKVIRRYMDRGELKASSHFGGPVGTGVGQEQYHIEEAELRRFIVAHCYDLVGRNVDLPGVVYVLTGGEVAAEGQS
jgi:hypothetical protein